MNSQYKNGDYVIIAKQFLAEIVGVYNSLSYIVKWYDFPEGCKDFPCCVIDLSIIEDATQEQITEHLHSLLGV
jgi:hypothetical protein